MGIRYNYFAMDVTDEAAAANAVMAAVDVFDSLDVVINNAGYDNVSSVEDTLYRNSGRRRNEPLWNDYCDEGVLRGYFRKRKRASSFSFRLWAEGLALRDVGPIRRRSGVWKELLRGAFARSGATQHQGRPIVEPGGFPQTSRAVPPNFVKVILNTIRRLELPQDFSGTTTASSLVIPIRQLRRSFS